MTEPLRPRAKYVIGPDGSPLTIADLPAPGTQESDFDTIELVR